MNGVESILLGSMGLFIMGVLVYGELLALSSKVLLVEEQPS